MQSNNPSTTRRISKQPAPRRQVWFRVAAVVTPLLGFILIECMLRVAGYGYPTTFFLKSDLNGQPVFVENQQFSRRYFPSGLERTPQPLLFAAHKSPDATRVFVFGESAAMGDPEPAFGFPRILEVMLRESMPGQKIEVINVAVTAINSHVIRDIAKDCADKQGDYWLVYMGNNEVVGPFGAGTIFGNQAPGLAFIRANLALKSTRIGQLLDALHGKFSGRTKVSATWEGMEMFLHQQVARDDPRMAKVHEHFEVNLRDIIQLGEKSGAKVLVSTIASNLKDCAPFASLHQANLVPAQKRQWEKFFQAGVVHESATNHAGALTSYEQAAQLDDRHAELLFRIGQCQRMLGKFPEARQSFELARDLDALRFRADSRINETIRRQAASRSGATLIDAADIMAHSSPHGISGEENFYEHVHFNFSGNYRVARAFAEKILGLATNSPPLLNEAECARRLAFTDLDRYRVLDEVRRRLQQPPFTSQLGHAERDRRIAGELKRLDRASLTNAMQVYEQAIARSPEDWVLRENFATLMQDFGQTREAEAQWREATRLLPHSEQAYFALGNLLEDEGRSEEAIVAYREALQQNSGSAESRNGLGLALAGLGRFTEAVVEYKRALRRNPGFAEARVNLGQALAQQGDFPEATAQYLEVLRQQSNNVPARINLGKLLALQDRHTEAASHYREALRLAPDNAIAHYNLGNALNALGDGDAAVAHFAEAVRNTPAFPEARYNLALGLAKLGRNNEVIEHLSEAVRMRPSFVEAHFNLGVALAKSQRFDEAASQFREALRLEPANTAARKALEQAEARLRQEP